MQTASRVLLGGTAFVAAFGLAACNNWLTGDKLSQNPNRPSLANADQLFVGVQVQTFATFTGRYPMQLLPMYARQFAGVARQWTNYSTFNGSPTETEAEDGFNDVYGRGGLTDIRAIEDATKTAGNDRFLGIAQVYEGLRIGTAADVWGDIPYSEALTAAKPKLDPQLTVYAAVQTVLDNAIANLTSNKGAGPTAVDFVYGNDAQKWVRAAHTLKARFYMHMSRGTDSTAMFQKAISEAQLGIRNPSDDWIAVYTTTSGEQNLYYNFLNSRSGDVEADSVYIETLKSRGDQALLNQLFQKKTGCTDFFGSTPGKSVACASQLSMLPNTPMSIVTAAENDMILAEAQYRTGQAAAALLTLNAFRAKIGYTAVSPTGVGILTAILQEKYVRLYLNPEVYIDYLRTCYPNFQIPYAKVTYVPGRLPYGFTERIANSNIPSVSDQKLASTAFPKNAKDPTGAVCYGQANRPGA